MSELIADGTRKARKAHQCYDCYRPIREGESHYYQTVKGDYIDTIRMHHDCRKASDFYIKFHDLKYYHFDTDGYPPLADMISDFGEYMIDHNVLRGHFPHVVCRLEWHEQMADLKMEKRRLEEA